MPVRPASERGSSESPLPDLSDLRSSGARQRRAVEQLYEAFAGRLRRYFRRHRSSPAEAEDLTQDVFVRVLRSLPEFRGEQAQFAGWVWAIARNRMLDLRRSAARSDFVDIDDPDGPGPDLQSDPAVADPARLQEDGSVRDCVQRGFASFAAAHPERAQCLSWLATDMMDIAAVAATLGRSIGATREFLSQCRKKLRPYIEHCLDPQGTPADRP